MPQPELVTSPANPLLKDIRKAISRGTLTSGGYCVAETLHLLEEAIRSPCRIHAVVAGESARAGVEAHLGRRDGMRMAIVPDKLLDASSQGVVALVEPPSFARQAFDDGLVLVLDALQDPGNLGTILRSAEAFGAARLLLVKGTVNPFNPKVVRSSAGSIFRVPFLPGLDAAELARSLRERGSRVYAALPAGGTSIVDADLRHPSVIVIGSEGRGVSAPLHAIAAGLSIPTAAVESLNAAVSAAIILYEAWRQRSSPKT